MLKSSGDERRAVVGIGIRQFVEPRADWAVPANWVTAGRIAVLPVFAVLVVQHKWAIALGVLVAVGASDVLDGWLARNYGQVTVLGTKLDPIADRLTALTVAGSFVLAALLPWWVLVALVVPDLVLLILLGGREPPPVDRVGKIRTVLLLIGLPLVLIAQLQPSALVAGVALWIVVVAVAGHLLAAIRYGIQIIRER